MSPRRRGIDTASSHLCPGKCEKKGTPEGHKLAFRQRIAADQIQGGLTKLAQKSTNV